MRVLQVIDTLAVGGAEKIVVLLSNLLKKESVNVAVLVLLKAGALKEKLAESIFCHELNRSSRFSYASLKNTAEILKEYDIIHVHLKHNYRYIALVNKLFRLRKKVIFHNHSHTSAISVTSSKSIKHKLLQWFFKPKYYISVNKEFIDYATRDLKVAPEYAFILENTIEQLDIEIVAKKRKGIVVVSNITPIKNLTFAVAFAKAVEKPITIFGKISNSIYYKELQEFISEVHMNNKVTFVHDCNEVQPYLNNFEFGIHTSLKETGPLVLVEFLAQGLPFISKNSGEVFENLGAVISDNFVSSFEISEWKKALDTIEAISAEKLKSIYKKHYSTEAYLTKCLKIYQHIEAS